MDIEKEIRTMVRGAVMEEINALSINAVLREKIVEAGFTHEDIKNMIREMADSYFRSAMNGSVEGRIKEIFDAKIEETVKAEIKKVINSFSGWSGSDKIKDALTRELSSEVQKGFDVSVTVTPRVSPEG